MVVSGDAEARPSPRRTATPMGCGGDVDGHGTAEKDARRISGDSWSPPSKKLDGPSLGSTKAAGWTPVAHRDSPLATGTVGSVASAGRGECEVAASVDALVTDHLLEETKANPNGSPGREPGLIFPAPVCYGETLEDLVCWTKQLDFKAIEGY